MSEVRQLGTLDVSQNLGLQRKMWLIERLTWGVMAIVFILIALGLSGSAGPLNYATASNSKLAVDYEPYAHRLAGTDVAVTLKQLSGSSAQLLVSRDFLSAYQVQQISPQPDSVTASGDMLRYAFSVAPGTQQMQVDLALRTNRYAVGPQKGLIGPDPQHLVKISQLIYP